MHIPTEILDDPRRIFNADETAFFLNPKGDRVLAARGDKTVYKVLNSDEKECLTVLISGNAAGDLAPSMVIFKYERIPKELSTSVPESWGIGKSETCWMTGETFFEFITNIFYPWVVENNINLPVILFIDGHASHLTFHVSKFCEQHKIILIALFPNATHRIQPMDVAVFRTLKAGWRDNVSQWRLENFNNPILKKIHFCPLLKRTLAERINSQILQNGFSKYGLFPWNPSAVEEEVEKENKLSEKTNNEKKLNDISKGLLFVEKYISKEKLAKFKNCSVWDGDITDQSLFEFYMNISLEKSDQEKEIGKKNNFEINDTQQNQEEIVRTSRRTETFEKLDEEDEIAENSLQNCSKNSSEIPKEHAYSCEIINNRTPVKEDGQLNNIIFSPTQEASQKVVCAYENVPTPFKKALFWPGPKPSKAKKNKKEKIPSVTTSKNWQTYYEKKELKKKQLEEEKKKRFEERKRKKEMKIAEKENALKIKKMSRKKKRCEYSDTSSEDEWEASDSSLDDVNVFEKDDEDINSNQIEQEEPQDSFDLRCKEGDYILVSFPGKKRSLKFVCVVQELLENDELEIIGMKKCTDSGTRLFVLNEKDVSTITKSQITKLLKFPKMYAAGDRLKYEFSEDFEVDG